uniref:EF-hand domain-containing protein n=1 Tax=Pseudo-nitzschia australis TaxID=44445 RepID=A0A7S4ATB9_9STRA|mmetsp:Transcript_26891/g.59028  ORF Transcript_26891/g.59028 Transcript_26891/m.59028 type:complete len:436 (-) Transcript_26891:353-1660(-)
MKFGIFNGKRNKDLSEASSEGALISNSSASSDLESGSSRVSIEWDNLYVEIDDDANGAVAAAESSANDRDDETTTVAADKSQARSMTVRQSGSRRNSIHRAASELTMDDSGAPIAFAASKSYTMMEDNPRSLSDADMGTMLEEDPTLNVDDIPDLLPRDQGNISQQFTITRDGKYLSNNHFANAQLMRWKHASEEGPSFIQVLAFFAAIGAIITTMLPVVTIANFWSIPVLICAFHTTMLCCVIIAFEMRSWGIRNPMSLRARIRNLLVRYLNILRFVWGRGLLYIFTGSMNLTIYYYPYTYYSGGALIGLGTLGVLVGGHSASNLERLRLSLTDHSFLWSKFAEADSDGDNMVDISDFSNLIWSLGLELDDTYTYRAFTEIDKNFDSRISFREFEKWWIASQDGDETILSRDMSKFSAVPTTSSPKRIPAHIKV